MEQILSCKSKTHSRSSNFPGYYGNRKVIIIHKISPCSRKLAQSGNASLLRSVGARIELKLEHRLFLGRHFVVFSSSRKCSNNACN